jgi:hypothetical protein
MRRLVLAVVALGVGTASLGASELDAQASDSTLRLFPGIWVRGETEGPLFCITFSKDSTALLTDSRRHVETYHWSYDSISGYLSLTFPRLPRDVIKMLAGAAGYELVSFDTLTRTAVQYVRDGQMWLTGYTLFPASSLDSVYYALARRACRLPARTEPRHQNER